MFGCLRPAARRVAWGRVFRRGALLQGGCHARNSQAHSRRTRRRKTWKSR